MDLTEIGLEDVKEINLAQDRDKFVGSCECGNEPSGSKNSGEFLD
jgi:hypothetical protein